MLNLNKEIELNAKQKSIIAGFGILTAEHWKRNQTRLRKNFTMQLKDFQEERCVYCGCKVQEGGDVDHIAEKSAYPEFVFTPANLAYSCGLCNQKLKGSQNVIEHWDNEYQKCTFKIIHPYFDDVGKFFITDKPKITYVPGLSGNDLLRAQNTFEVLKWNDPRIASKRARDIIVQRYEYALNTTAEEIAVENTLTYIHIP